ncbi:MAG: dynamin family protein, partial [Actinomycetota bacterium]
MTLLDQTRHVLALAAKEALDTPLAASIAQAQERLDDPLRVAVAGRVKAGKSTLVNAMVGERIAPTDARECTRIVTWYRDGVTYRVAGVAVDGSRSPLRFDRDGGALHVELDTTSPEELSAIEVEWPSSRLREMTIVDTPGIDSITDGLSARAERFLMGSDERPTPTDAVLYLLRHVHAADIGFLEAFHDDDMAAANPVNSIGVLSRADEIGAARHDAMSSAQRIAQRWAGDRRLARLVQAVVPVAGLLAEGASTLRQAEFELFAALARADRGLVDELLVSADRFARSSAPVGVVDAERAAVLDRFGLFG